MKPSTERDYHRRIARVVEAILADPGAPHSLDSLAAVAHLSPFHFHRIYRALTGESVVDTVQRVRLARAAHRLTVADDLVGDVAANAGYESPQAFSRAFRGFAGVSPSGFQMRQKHLSTLWAEADPSASTGPSPQRPDTPHVELIELAPFDVLCLRHHGPPATITQTFRTLRTLWPQLGGDAAEGRYNGPTIGICSGDSEEPDSFSYLAGIIPATPVKPTGAIELVRVEGGLYATYRLIGPYALIAPTFQALFGGWLPNSGYEPDDRPALEFYRNQPSRDPQKERVTDLMIPLRKD